MYEYPIIAHEEAGSFWSSCPDIPEAHSAGDTIDELLANAVEGLTLAFTIYVDQGREIPLASPVAEHQYAVPLSALTAQKIALWNGLVAKNMKVADLARALNLSHTVASRLVDFEHKSKTEMVETALKAIGVKVLVEPLPVDAVSVHFYFGVNPEGRLTVLATHPDVPFSAVPREVSERYAPTARFEELVDLNRLSNHRLLEPGDKERLRENGWVSFVVAPMAY